jgi:hypothetical protein
VHRHIRQDSNRADSAPAPSYDFEAKSQPFLEIEVGSRVVLWESAFKALHTYTEFLASTSPSRLQSDKQSPNMEEVAVLHKDAFQV